MHGSFAYPFLVVVVLGSSAAVRAGTSDGRDPFLKSMREFCEAREKGSANKSLTPEQENHKDFLSALPTRKPICGLHSRNFGMVKSKTGARVMHEGIDIRTPGGKKVVATAPGKVVFVGCAEKPAGREDCHVIAVMHGYGLVTYYSGYAKALVKLDQSVCRGQSIAESAAGDLHYEVQVNGVPVDPMSYIQDAN